MAKLVNASPAVFTRLRLNQGETHINNLLKQIDEPWEYWHEPTVYKGRTPDFVIWTKDKTYPAILVVEVKDWSRNYIERVTKQRVFLKKTKYKEARDEPLPTYKLERIAASIKNGLITYTDSFPELDDIPLVPVLCFTQMESHEIPEELRNEQVGILAWQSMQTHQGVRDGLMRYVKQAYQGKSAPEITRKFNKVISQNIDISTNVYAASGNVNPKANGFTRNTFEPEFCATLDLHQKKIVQGRKDGPFLLSGLPGTGKTIILLARASWYCSKNPYYNALLIVNQKVLSKNLEQKYDYQYAPGNRKNFRVMTFLEWLKYTYEDVNDIYPNTDMEDIEELTDLIVTDIGTGDIKKKKDAKKFGLILVDEAHQLKPEWLALIPEQAAPVYDKPNVWISYDNGQGIYQNRRFHGPTVGFDFRGRAERLRRVYRSGMRPWVFAACCHPKALDLYKKEADLGSDLVEFTKEGEHVKLITSSTLESQARLLCEYITNRFEKGEIRLSDVCIFYPKAEHDREDLYPNPYIKKVLSNAFHQIGGLEWVAYDKDKANWTTERVRACTFTSSQGIDSPISVVFAVELFSMYSGSEWADPMALFYTVLTRATNQIILTYKSLDDRNCAFQKALDRGIVSYGACESYIKAITPERDGETDVFKLDWRQLEKRMLNLNSI